MQRYLSILLLFILASAPLPVLRAEYTTLEKAIRKAESGNIAEAIEHYRAFIEQEPENPDTLVARFNLAHALFNAGRFDSSAARFSELAALLQASEEIRTNARYNAGNAFAEQAMKTGVTNRKRTLLKAALRQYRAALMLDPQDMKSKINHEIIMRRLDALEPDPSQKGVSAPDNPSPAQQDITTSILQRASLQEEAALQEKFRNTSKTSGKKGGVKDW